MHEHSRLQSVLSHVDTTRTNDLERLENNLRRIFKDMPSQMENHLVLSPCNNKSSDFDPGEPNDRFVQLSRNLQKEKEKRQRSKFIYPTRPILKENETPIEVLFDPKVLLGVASTGLALAFLPSSSPVSRSLLVIIK